MKPIHYLLIGTFVPTCFFLISATLDTACSPEALKAAAETQRICYREWIGAFGDVFGGTLGAIVALTIGFATLKPLLDQRRSEDKKDFMRRRDTLIDNYYTLYRKAIDVSHRLKKYNLNKDIKIGDVTSTIYDIDRVFKEILYDIEQQELACLKFIHYPDDVEEIFSSLEAHQKSIKDFRASVISLRKAYRAFATSGNRDGIDAEIREVRERTKELFETLKLVRFARRKEQDRLAQLIIEK
ncbi:hypothetical protein [Roseibium sp.]|uniref:hypothetical protein n=1 Tax=Roseibium sp. TaxID=1936156 RepID=UPI001B07B890|nr:hypothetical protein [Roseibium sp.]MBO6857581.1 hypothetical protein [Roseibium sp.]